MGKMVYTRGFPLTFTKANLSKVFRQFGRLKQVQIISKDRILYGLVRFYNDEHAQNAVESIHGKFEDGIFWYVAICENFSARNINYIRENRKSINRERSIYLRDFPDSFTKEAAAEIFLKYGDIVDVLIEKPTGVIIFKENESADLAAEGEKLLIFEGKRVYVGKLQERSILDSKISKKKLFKLQRNTE